LQPFAKAVIDAMEDSSVDDGSAPTLTRIVVYVGLRLYVVVMILLFLYGLMHLVQMIVGKGDIVKVEEIIIVHEHETEEEAERARLAAKKQGRSKKQKDQ
jgi:hypothetical protein